MYFAKMWDEANRKNPFTYPERRSSFSIDCEEDALCYKKGGKYKMSFTTETFGPYDEDILLRLLKNIAQTRPSISFDVRFSMHYFNCNQVYTKNMSYCDNKFEIYFDDGDIDKCFKLTEKGFKKVPKEVWNSKKEVQIPVYTFDKNNIPKTDQINVLIDKNTVNFCLQNIAETVEYKKLCILIDFIDSPFRVVALNSNSGRIIFL